MNQQVPDFEMDADYALEESTTLGHFKGPSSSVMDEIKELIWQDGQVVTQSQTQRSASRRTPTRVSSMSPPWKYDHEGILASEQLHSAVRDFHQNDHHQNLFVSDDDMVPWPYTLPTNFDDNGYLCDLVYATPPSTATTTAAVASLSTGGRSYHNMNGLNQLSQLVPVASSGGAPPPLKTVDISENLSSMPKQRGRVPMVLPAFAPSPDGGANDPRPPSTVVRESTVVDSSSTPGIYCPALRISDAAAVARSATAGVSSADYCGGTRSCATATATDTAAATTSNTTTNRETATCDITATSSTGGSSASAHPPPVSSVSPTRETAGTEKSTPPPCNTRKRKGIDDEEFPYVEDADFESANQKKKQARCPSSTKRTRAAEVHNLSERRRRDRINERLRALYELIPRRNKDKSDKASMLDEAIEYVKSLQMYMMSMGCGMVPMMFPGIQQYMPTMGMGLGLNVGMDMGMNRPILQFPNVLGGASLSAPVAAAAAATNLGPRFPVPAFHIPPVAAADPSRLQGACVQDPMLNSLGIQNPNHVRVPNFMDPFHPYLGIPQIQLSVMQNQGMIHPSTSQTVDNNDKNQATGQ